ncbi:CbtA family protein [Methylocystis sp. ATCC 49242]|uniref:CbtA family protein n=1 Tax=Methylocystis sp. ATCC 49242 TaxID=622637 RepID=UPI0001F8841E|nr:CbtA family protein [Methylocystis sp. ATCC 49242]
MIARTLAAGLIAGVVAGLAVAALQHVTTTPLILAAEVYETAQHAHDVAAEHAAPAFEGLRRTAATSLATVAVSIGYALILLAGMLVSGDPIGPRRAALWGACAFAATGLATSLGLAPQLPGAAETDLAGRQIWWVAAAVSTGAGLYALLRLDAWIAQVAGAVLIVAPHFFTPTPAAPESTAPAELAAQFAASSLAVQAMSWVLAGALVGLVWRLISQDETQTA